MTELEVFQHWRYERGEDHIVWLTLDRQNASVNTLNQEVLTELQNFLKFLSQENLPKGLVIQSQKKNGFIAGADIKEFSKLESKEKAFELLRQGQTLFAELAACPFPTVALIRGFCLGGGLELALACRYRIAIEEPSTKLGFPEVRLGIHPGWGGLVRLPRLLGAVKALDLILSQRSLSAKVAEKIGLVDAAVPERQSLKAVSYYITHQPKPLQASFLAALSNTKWVRPLLGKWLQARVSAKINCIHYPAPRAVIEHWVNAGVLETAFVAEAKSVADLFVTATARNLGRVFELQERLKGLEKDKSYRPKHIHVIGAGVMGGDIAAWCALKGFSVTLADQNLMAIAKTLGRAKVLFQKQLKESHLVVAAMDRLIPDSKGNGVKEADLIIEAIVEKRTAKNQLFLALEKIAKKDAIFATNTSTISLEEIGEGLSDKERLIGIHFFNPVAKMPLVEIVQSAASSPEVIKKAITFVRLIDKLPLPVKSTPGFLVNRVLMPYLTESALLLEEGISAVAIDNAALTFGMPMGPLELMDKVGLDVCLDALESLMPHLEGVIPSKIKQLVAEGHLGQKTGQGFYRYRKDKIIKEKLAKHYRMPTDITDRLISRLLNEAVAVLREQIVSDQDLIDAGLLFGAGFPAFRGGPIHYAQSLGIGLLRQRLSLLAERYGARFLPDPGWQVLQNQRESTNDFSRLT
jgi:3-hydroxyacyl-CoA dehydrogenase/enoyl-CoA hydratase/3-hydroxybutyryl-CoA epimerase